MGLSWMAWTGPTAAFFIFIGLCFVAMSVWEYVSPGGGPRHGVLGLDTTRGDRLFLALRGRAFRSPPGRGRGGPDLGGPLAIAVAYAVAVFRWV